MTASLTVSMTKHRTETHALERNTSKSLHSPQPHSEKELKEAAIQGRTVPISEEQLIKAIERAIKAMQGARTSLEFSIHEKTNQIMVKVKNAETGEVIREIPPERNLDFLAKVWEMAGLLIDERR